MKKSTKKTTKKQPDKIGKIQEQLKGFQNGNEEVDTLIDGIVGHLDHLKQLLNPDDQTQNTVPPNPPPPTGGGGGKP